MTTECRRFELDLERRAHGALGGDEERRLDGHLAACARCRELAGLITASEAYLRGAAATAAREVAWAAIERRLGERARRMRRAGWLVPVALLSTALVSFLLGLPLRGALVMGAGALVATVATRALRARWLHELARATASPEGVLGFSRRQVDAELRASSRGAVALAALAALQVFGIEVLGRPSSAERSAVLGGGAVLLVAASFLALREIPRLRRERAELS